LKCNLKSLTECASGEKPLDNDRYKWYVVGMLWCIALFNYADRQAIFSLFPLLQKEMHLSTVELGLLGSSFAWVYGLAAPFAGNIVDRIRRKTAILGGLYVWSTIALATPLARSFQQLFGFMAAEGLGETIYFPASMSIISDYHGRATRSRAMGFHQTSVYAGTIMGGFFAGLIGEYYGWRWSFLCFGGAGILLGFVLARFLREPKRGAADLRDSGADKRAEIRHRIPMREFLKLVLRTPSALLLMGAFMCANFVALVLLSWMPKFLYDKFHLSLAMAGLSATLFVQVASMAGSPLGGWLADLLRKRMAGGRMLVQAIAVFCGAPFVVICGQTKTVLGVVLALTAWGLFKGLYDSNIFASVYDVIPAESRGAAAGFMNMVGWLGGGGTAPLVIGFLAERRGLSMAISSAALVYVGAGVLLTIAVLVFARRDVARMEQRVRAEAEIVD
jgi:sugar phosphate permease